MKRALILAAALVALSACDGSNNDRLSDDQATAEAVGPEADNVDANLIEGAETPNEATDLANKVDEAANDSTPAKKADADEPKVDPNAPSFQCAGLLNPVEDMICSTPELARRDRIVAGKFAKAMKEGSPDQQDRLKAIGRRYLTDRNRCDDVDCVMQAYRWYARDIDGLMGWPATL